LEKLKILEIFRKNKKNKRILPKPEIFMHGFIEFFTEPLKFRHPTCGKMAVLE